MDDPHLTAARGRRREAMKAIIDSLDQVPEAMRAEYTERNGKFVLNLEGEHPAIAEAVGNANSTITDLRSKVDGFRDTNTRIFKALGIDSGGDINEAIRQAEARGAIDPAEYTRLQEQAASLKKSGVNKADDLAAIIAREVGKVSEQLNARLDESEKKRVDAENAASSEKLRSSLSAAAIKAGVAESAVDDFITRGLSVFKIIDGKVQAVGPNGTPLFSEKRAGVPLDPEEYAAGLQKTAPHLFKGDVGSGSTGSPGGSQGGNNASREIPASEFGDNIEKIASGEVTVPVPWEQS